MKELSRRDMLGMLGMAPLAVGGVAQAFAAPSETADARILPQAQTLSAASFCAPSRRRARNDAMAYRTLGAMMPKFGDVVIGTLVAMV